jgi:hypothetical protein
MGAMDIIHAGEFSPSNCWGEGRKKKEGSEKRGYFSWKYSRIAPLHTVEMPRWGV